MSTTLKDIAKTLDLSVSTVSKALSGSKGISELTKKAVFSAVEKSDYRLRKTKRKSVAFVIDKDYFVESSQFYAPIIAGVEEQLVRNSYYFEFNSVDRADFSLEKMNINFRDLAGVIMVNYYHDEMDIKLRQLDIPLVLIDYYIPTEDIPTVIIDNADGILRVCKHLASLGHKRIGYISGVDVETTTQERMHGFRMGQNFYRFDRDEDLVVMDCSLTKEEGFKAMTTLLSRGARPSAVVCYNDLLAAGAMEALRDKGLSIPRDVSVTGFDDFSFGAELDPPLTTVHVPLKDMGTLAVAKLVEIIKGEQSPINKILVSTRLIVRNSTGAAAG